MRIISILLLAFLVGCTNDDEPKCNCGTIIEVIPNQNNTQWKYTYKGDCDGAVLTWESRVEILKVGDRKCK